MIEQNNSSTQGYFAFGAKEAFFASVPLFYAYACKTQANL